MKTVSILGATGSIGHSTLDVVLRHPERFRIQALTAHNRVDKLLDMAERCDPDVLAVSDMTAGSALERGVGKRGLRARVAVGPKALRDVAGMPADVVMAAIVGAAGLEPTLAAAAGARTLLLANKEAIVMAGALFMQTCAASGVRLLPVDSEHNALFQCMPPGWQQQCDQGAEGLTGGAPGVRSLILTASGGPFRTRPLNTLMSVTPDEACAHPKWSMGRKISVDSATMMNKGLELIEASHLFCMPPDQLSVLIHPQSIVHSLVEYTDGSVLAQMGEPDMRIPIAHALGFPDRVSSGAPLLDLARTGRLDFETPDLQRFPAIGLALDALRGGRAIPCILNAVNEISVESFLAGQIRFTDIVRINQRALEAMSGVAAPASLADVMDLDAEARVRAAVWVREARQNSC